MSVTPQMQALSLDQAPPLAVPASFFLTAPLFVIAAGLSLAARDAAALTSPWDTATIGLTHLITLGYLALVMMGALFQMLPVVVGARVPAPRLAHAVLPLVAVGAASLGGGLLLSSRGLLWAAVTGLTLGVLLFLAPVGWALARAPARTETAHGMRLAVACLVVLAVLGIWMAHGHAGALFPGDRRLWLLAHAGVALFGWVGGLLVAVSFQVVPMFYLAPEVTRPLRRALLLLVALGALCPPLVLVLAEGGLVDVAWAGDLVVWAALPGALAVFLAHPVLVLRTLAARKRKRADASLRFWRAGLLAGPLTLVAGACAALVDDDRTTLLYGFLALWAWAGTIVHGMLTRIVPFLVWWHRFSPLVGRADVPSMRALWPEGRARLGFGLHLAATLTGLVGIGLQWEPALRLLGVLVAATGLSLVASIAATLRRRPESAHPSGSAGVPGEPNGSAP